MKRFWDQDIKDITNPSMLLFGMPAAKTQYRLLMEQLAKEEDIEKWD